MTIHRINLMRAWTADPCNRAAVAAQVAAGEDIDKYLMDNVFTPSMARLDLAKLANGATAESVNRADPPASVPASDATATLAALADLVNTKEDSHTVQEKACIKKVLMDGLPLIGLQPVSVKSESKAADMEEFEAWDLALDKTTDTSKSKLGWPIHPAVTNVRTALMNKLQKDATVDSNVSQTLKSYDRVPDSVIPLGPKYFWLRKADPGWEVDKRPKDAFPCTERSSSSEPKTVSLNLSDIRAHHVKHKRMVQVVNTLGFGVDMLRSIMQQHVPQEHEHRELSTSILTVVGKAVSSLAADATAMVINHQAWERQATFERDTRLWATTLPDREKVKARSAPMDSDSRVFGATPTELEANLKKRFEEVSKSQLTAAGFSGSKPATSKKPSKPFRGTSAQRGRGTFTHKQSTPSSKTQQPSHSTPGGRGGKGLKFQKKSSQRGRGRGDKRP